MTATLVRDGAPLSSSSYSERLFPNLYMPFKPDTMAGHSRKNSFPVNLSYNNSRYPNVPTAPEAKVEEEPTVEALDLRICMQNESISHCDFSKDILGEGGRKIETTHPPSAPPSPVSPAPWSFFIGCTLEEEKPSYYYEPDPRLLFLPKFENPGLVPPVPARTLPSPMYPFGNIAAYNFLESMKYFGCHHQYPNPLSNPHGLIKDHFPKRVQSSPALKIEENIESSLLENKLSRINDAITERKSLPRLQSELDFSRLPAQQNHKSSPIPKNNDEKHHIRKLFEDGFSSEAKQELSPFQRSLLYYHRESSAESEKSKAGGHSKYSCRGKRGRPRKHSTKVPLPPLYIFLRNLIHNDGYNPRVISWINENSGVFKVNQTGELARTWGKMKSNRSEEMNYEKMSRAMRYHYGNEKKGRRGHLAMVKEKRLVYKFGELAVNWKAHEVVLSKCQKHPICKGSFCLWSKE